MSILATLDEIEGELYVRWELNQWSIPVKRTLWWRVERVARSPFRPDATPQSGDPVRALGGGVWSGDGYTVAFSPFKDAERIEETAIPCPPTRGKQTRYQDGRWEKLMARGWVPA